MNATIETKERELSHAEQNAKASVANIVEMVRACNRETAAEDYAATLDADKCKSIIEDGTLYCSDCDDLEALRDAVAAAIEHEEIEPDGFEFDQDEARQRIQEDALSVEVRGDWHAPGEEDVKASEFCILLTTGGPALRIMGELDEHMQPSRAWLEHQDWGTPWTQWFDVEQETLLEYCRNFYFGE